jgi:hypothetical protein
MKFVPALSVFVAALVVLALAIRKLSGEHLLKFYSGPTWNGSLLRSGRELGVPVSDDEIRRFEDDEEA